MDWGKIISAAVPAIVTGGAGLLTSSIAQDQQTAATEAAKAQSVQDNILQLQLAQLKAQYGGGGGSGGGGTDPNRITAAQRLAAVAGQGSAQQNAIADLLGALQSSYGLQGR